MNKLSVGSEIFWPKQHSPFVWTVTYIWENSVTIVNDLGSVSKWKLDELEDTIDRGFTVLYTGGVPQKIRQKLWYIDGNYCDFRNIERIEISGNVYFVGTTTWTRRLVGVVSESGKIVRKLKTIEEAKQVLGLSREEPKIDTDLFS